MAYPYDTSYPTNPTQSPLPNKHHLTTLALSPSPLLPRLTTTPHTRRHHHTPPPTLPTLQTIIPLPKALPRPLKLHASNPSRCTRTHRPRPRTRPCSLP